MTFGVHTADPLGQALRFREEHDCTPEAWARHRRLEEERHAKRREREVACALDFIYEGNLTRDGELPRDARNRLAPAKGRHGQRCVHDTPCGRDYQPMPYPEAEPSGDFYEGTGIGLLYGLAGPAELAADLAGWNLTGPTERLLGQELHTNVTAPPTGQGLED